MSGLAVAASCMPSHADWLNDLSLMPPVSVTMQPTNLPAAGALPAEVAAPDAEEVLELLADEVLLPQAAISTATAAAAIAAANEVCFTGSPPLDQIADAQATRGRSLAQIARRLFRPYVRREETFLTAATSLSIRGQNVRYSRFTVANLISNSSAVLPAWR